MQLPSTNPDSTTANDTAGGSSSGRKIETVVFSGYEIQTWYSSPYPTSDDPSLPGSTTTAEKSRAFSGRAADPKDKGKAVDTTRAGRGVADTHKTAEAENAQTGATLQRLFVCDGCFKYMVQPAALPAHKVRRLARMATIRTSL